MTIRQGLTIALLYAIVLAFTAGGYALNLLTSPPPFRSIEVMR
jgi:hypothetical protein